MPWKSQAYHIIVIISRSQSNYNVIAGKQSFFILRSRENYPIISGKWQLLFRDNNSRSQEMKLTCHHGTTEEIKCMNAWPFRAIVHGRGVYKDYKQNESLDYDSVLAYNVKL